MYFLSIGAIFKNESCGLEEWILNHLNEGVEHFYLINNGSTDNFMPIIKKYNEYITLYNDDTKHSQIYLYNKYFMPIKKFSKWMMIIDLDEFVYSRKNYNKITDYLKNVNKNISKIALFWKMYGSSGYIDQPDSIIHSFVNRSNILNIGMWTKQIVRTSQVKMFKVHNHLVYNEIMYIGSNNKIVKIRNKQKYLSENDSMTCLSNLELHLNHYCIQSYKWFKNVKMTRGDVIYDTHDNFRNDEYFRNNDTNDVFDNELSLKIGDLNILKEKYSTIS
jgi:hypothetical protein